MDHQEGLDLHRRNKSRKQPLRTVKESSRAQEKLEYRKVLYVLLYLLANTGHNLWLPRPLVLTGLRAPQSAADMSVKSLIGG